MSNNENTGVSRSWLVGSGILFLLTGFAAMMMPVFFTAVVVKALAFFVLASGVFSLVMALVGKHKGYRLLEILSGIIRIVAGVVLLYCLKQSAFVITIAFAIYLMVEGVFVVLASLKLHPTPGWAWSLFNGVGALVLGFLIFRGWPSSSFTILGVFFGINMLMKGASNLALGIGLRERNV